MNIGFLIAIFLVFLFSLPKIEISNFILADLKNFVLPYGVILFSLIGWNAVPEIEGFLKNKKNLKKVIVKAILICIIFYFLFGMIISGVTGRNTTPEAFRGLVGILGTKIMILGGIFGLLAVSTSFLILASYLKNALIFDYNFSYFPAFLVACFSPLILFLMGIREFISVVAVVGSLVGLLEGIVITFIYKKAKKLGDRTPEYSLRIPISLIYLTIIILSLGTITHFLQYFS